MKKTTKNLLLDVSIGGATLGLLLVSILGFIPTWPLELFAHFRWNYVLVAGALITWLFFSKRHKKSAGKKLLVLLIITGLYNLFLVGSVYWISQPAPTRHEELTVLFSNIWIHNEDPTKLFAVIDEVDPDVVAMAEVTDETFATFSTELKSEYPFAFHRRERRTFGVAMFGKQFPQNEELVRHFSDEALPSIQADFIVNEKAIRVILTHPFPPVAQWGAKQRNAQLTGLADTVKTSALPVIVVGDFNMTPWSPYFPNILKDSGLKNSLVGAGFQPSWPTFLPEILRIPIDHALVSPEIEVIERKVGPHVGSDHRPLILKVALPTN